VKEHDGIRIVHFGWTWRENERELKLRKCWTPGYHYQLCKYHHSKFSLGNIRNLFGRGVNVHKPAETHAWDIQGVVLPDTSYTFHARFAFIA
jgi:hypothetical protein